MHPLLLLQDCPCRPNLYAIFPQTQRCSSQITHPNLSTTAILATLLSESNTRLLEGITCNHFEDSCVDDESNLARLKTTIRQKPFALLSNSTYFEV